MGYSRPLFLYFCLFKTVDLKQWSIKIFRTTDLWCQKRPLRQLSHNHCPLVTCYESFLKLNQSFSQTSRCYLKELMVQLACINWTIMILYDAFVVQWFRHTYPDRLWSPVWPEGKISFQNLVFYNNWNLPKAYHKNCQSRLKLSPNTNQP